LNIPVLAAVPQRLSPFAKFGAGHGGNGNGNGNGRNGSNGSHSQAAAGTMTALMDSQDDQR